ncbi:glycosyltransferase [Eubacterium sp. 1001713B170207_170306_E7]|uniref:glycosyltransferase family protein n=1 Tax=Eubacterium sp. 1001713B170207_170306_E7 TaxID=2787097 RepID=UPI00189A90BE|nr:glycosyltransferase [Eubacterium sp. 1001713B170207_170306_E7]
MSKHKILYVIRCGLPENAAGLRVYRMARLLQKSGCRVDFLCALPTDTQNAGSVVCAADGERTARHQGFQYFVPKDGSGRLANMLELVRAGRLFKRVRARCEQEGYHTVILYNDPGALTVRLGKYCRKNGIRLIGDVTEWYERRKTGKMGERLMPFLVNRRIQKLDSRYLDGVIAVSHFFYEYYRRRGMKVVFVPPLMEGNRGPFVLKYDYYPYPVVNLVYAGAPGEKDLLSPLAGAVARLNRHGIRLRLDIAGVSEMELENIWKPVDYKKYGIFAHGRLPHREALRLVRRGDFCVLLRQARRYARAGFSTKMAECMSSGTAMICNEVAGPEQLFENGKEGFVIAETGELEALLEQLAGMDPEQVEAIKRAARKKAESLFNPKTYRAPVMKLIKDEVKNENTVDCG